MQLRKFVAIAVLCLSTLMLVGADRADRGLEDAKQTHDGEIKKADAELERAQLKFKRDKEQANAKLIKAYEEAIKRTTQRGDLEGANRLLAEKKALQAEAEPNSTAEGAAPSSPDKLNWAELPDDGLPAGFVIPDVGTGANDAEYVGLLSAGKVNEKPHGHEIQHIKAGGEGNFQGVGEHNVQTAYYAFYLQNESPQAVIAEIRTTPFGSLKVYLDGNQVLDHAANNKDAFSTKLPIKLRTGKHSVVVKYSNSWADCWFGLKLTGGKLNIAQ
jgi:hypothetical protein